MSTYRIDDDDEAWPELLRKSEGGDLSLQRRQRHDRTRREIGLSLSWCEQVRELVTAITGQATVNDEADINALEDVLIDVDRRHDRYLLGVEAIGSVHVVEERKALLEQKRDQRMRNGFATISEMDGDDRLHQQLFGWFTQERRRSSSPSSALLQHTGNLLQLSLERMLDQMRSSLLDRVDALGSVHVVEEHNSSSSPLELNKTSLNGHDCGKSLALSNGGFTATSGDESWSSVRTTSLVALYPRRPNHRTRHELATTLAMMRDPSRNLTIAALKEMLWTCLRALHGDTMEEGLDNDDTSSLHQALDRIGYHHPRPPWSPIQWRVHALDIVHTMQRRSSSLGRFAFEAIANGAHFEWMIGVTKDVVVRPDRLGRDRDSLGVGSDGRVYYDGQSMVFGGAFGAGVVVGVLIDVFNGSVIVWRDGVEVGVAFGRGTRSWPDVMVKEQMTMLMGDGVIPALAMRGKRGTALPQVSVNLGQLPFAYPIPGSAPVEMHRDIATEADLMRQDEESGDIVAKPGLRASVRTIVVEGGDVIESLPTEEEFLRGIAGPAPASFSSFPPAKARRLQAVIIVQRATRAFLIRMKQACFKRVVIEARGLKRSAALFIQRHWRGNRDRRITSLVRRKRIRFDVVVSYARRIQRWFRRLRTQPAYQARRAQRVRPRHGPHLSTIYGKLGRSPHDRLKLLNQEALKLQKIWRGRQARIAFFNLHPIDSIRLNNLGFVVRSRLARLRLFLLARPYGIGWLERARVAIRRRALHRAMALVHRSIRQYLVRSRLDELMDATLSEPLKKFIFLLGVESDLSCGDNDGPMATTGEVA